MSEATVIIRSEADRERIRRWATKVKLGTRVLFKETKRTIPQNDYMHALLTDLSTQLEWHGQKLSVQDWKLFFLDALKRELRIVPNMDGRGFVNLSRSTTELTVPEMNDYITIIQAFGVLHGVKFNDEKEAA